VLNPLGGEGKETAAGGVGATDCSSTLHTQSLTSRNSSVDGPETQRTWNTASPTASRLGSTAARATPVCEAGSSSVAGHR
jgi:hypothetical protein